MRSTVGVAPSALPAASGRSALKILLVGLSTRAMAASAVAAGYTVLTLDYFGDRDQRLLAEGRSLKHDYALDFSAEALLEASRSLRCDAVAYTSDLENHPSVVEEMARGRRLLGNAPETLRQVRDPATLRAFCQEVGIRVPCTVLPGESLPRGARRRWLCKPVASGGGHGVAFCDPAKGALAAGYLWQEHVVGLSCSASFVADGCSCQLIGLTEQLAGRPELGLSRPEAAFTWCGNLLPLDLPSVEQERLWGDAQAMAMALTRRFGLVGANGLDLVLGDDGELYLLEVNPRYSASMELIEWASGLSVFGAHCERMRLLPRPRGGSAAAPVTCRGRGSTLKPGLPFVQCWPGAKPVRPVGEHSWPRLHGSSRRSGERWPGSP